jgi:predicted metal-dependent peptidase
MIAAERIAKARAVLIAREPYFGVLALSLQVTERADVDTMATDGVGLFYSPAFVMGLSERELLGVVAHEVEHVARLHITRRGTREPALWNEACDHAINPGLLAAGFILPRGALYDARWRGMSAEAIYAELQRDGRPQGAQGAQGADPGRCGGVLDAPPGDGRDAMEADVQARVRQAAGIAKRAGRLPASAAEAVAALDAPRVSWRDVLRRFADTGARRDVSWTRPSRRDAGDGFILPGSVSVSAAHIVAIVDTSASMDSVALAAVGAELQSILDDGAADVVTIVQCDRRVQSVATYSPGDVLDVSFRGRGGTEFAPAFQWVADNAPDASGIVYLTDLDCDSFGDAPPCPVLWAATERVRPVPFGDVVAVDVHA